MVDFESIIIIGLLIVASVVSVLVFVSAPTGITPAQQFEMDASRVSICQSEYWMNVTNQKLLVAPDGGYVRRDVHPLYLVCYNRDGTAAVSYIIETPDMITAFQYDDEHGGANRMNRCVNTMGKYKLCFWV